MYLLQDRQTFAVSAENPTGMRNSGTKARAVSYTHLRYPIFNAYKKFNIVIAGQGTIDAGQLGWHERRGVLFSSCSECTVTGLTLLNMPEWSMITYCGTDIKISDVAVFGYKTNSDGIATVSYTHLDVYKRQASR